MRARVLSIVILLLTALSTPYAHDEVLADRIAMHAGDFLPRFLDASVVRRVIGVEKLDAGTYDYIEVEGTLTIPAVEVKVTTLVVLPGGRLTIECGATLIGRDVPIDTARDPFQWGNGLINFGTLVATCPAKTPYVSIASAPAGALQLTLQSPPVGWQVGDAVMVPDTRQMSAPPVASPLRPRREANATIAALSGNTLTLSKPIEFARTPITKPDGSVVLLPQVANLTRRTVIKSENANGVRWHTANVGELASWDVQGVAYIGLGRTKNQALDSTTPDNSKVGANQVGRYALHNHHNGTSLQTRRIASSAFDGMNGGKWAVALHQTHDTEVVENVCVDTPGGCFITEDGVEVRNTITGNFAAFATGNGQDSGLNADRACPGCESAYWFRGIGNTIDRNVAWNSQVGFNLFNQRQAAVAGVKIPAAKGEPATVTPNLANMVPMSMTGNVAAANAETGLEYWGTKAFPTDKFIAAHNGNRQVWNAVPERGGEASLVDAVIVCASGARATGIDSNAGYSTGLEMIRGEVRGCRIGVIDGIGRVFGRFTDTVFQNATNLVFPQPHAEPQRTTLTRVKFEPLAGTASTFIAFPYQAPWSGSGPFPDDWTGGWQAYETGPRLTVIDWQSSGKDYQFVTPAQSADLPVPVSDTVNRHLPPPECGPTMGEAFKKCGMAYYGVAYTTAVELEGVTGRKAIQLPREPLGAPKAVMTWPHKGVSVLPESQYGNSVPLYFAMTGDPTKADGNAYISIDGGPPRTVASFSSLGGGSYRWYWSGVITPGVHEVRAWRQLKGAEVPGSAMVFSYVVEGVVTPPPPPPPPADSDGDGVNDPIDKCPGTPPATKVDAAGCPIPTPPPGTSDLTIRVEPSVVHVGELYAVWVESARSCDEVNNVVLDGVGWGSDAQAGRQGCNPTRLWRPYTATSSRTHTVTAQLPGGQATASVALTVQPAPAYADGWIDAQIATDASLYQGVAADGGVVLVTDSANNATRVKRSTNGGQSFGAWSSLPGAGMAYIERPIDLEGSVALVAAVDATQTITDFCCARSVGPMIVWRSTDAGATWTRSVLDAQAKGLRVAVDLDGPNALITWMDFRRGVWDVYVARSTDSGQTWTTQVVALGTNSVGAERASVALSGTTAHLVWMDARDNKPACTIEGGTTLPVCTDVYYARSTNAGLSWSTTRLVTTTGYTGRPDVAASGSNVSIVYDWRPGVLNQANEIGLVQSSDGGASFSAPSVLDPHPAEQTHALIAYVGSTLQAVGMDARTGSYQIRAQSPPSSSQRLTTGNGAPAIAADASTVYAVTNLGGSLRFVRKAIGEPFPPPGDPCVIDPLSVTVTWPSDPNVTAITVTQVGRSCPPQTVTR